MSFLLLENRLSIDTLVVPGYLIDRFLPAASGTDVKVYLYLLRAVSTSATGLSSASISDRLDISEREVLRSLSYWESVGLMRLSFTSGHELSGVAFTDPSIQAETEASAQTAPTQTAASAPSVQSVIPTPTPALVSPANTTIANASGSMASTQTTTHSAANAIQSLTCICRHGSSIFRIRLIMQTQNHLAIGIFSLTAHQMSLIILLITALITARASLI